MFRLYIMSRESREEAKYLDSFEIDMDKINDQEYRKLFDMIFKTKLRDIDKTK